MEALGGQRIAGGRRAVVLQPEDLAERRLWILGRLELLPLAIGEEEVPVPGEGDAAGEVTVAFDVRRGAKDCSTFWRPAFSAVRTCAASTTLATGRPRVVK